MSLMRLAAEAVSIISALQSMSAVSPYLNCLEPGSPTRLNLLQKKADVEILKFLQDAYRFLLKNIQIIEIAPRQLYCSGLVFSPTNSIIRKTFKDQRPSWLCVFPQVERSWGEELQTLQGHSGRVWSVAFSPDGQRIMSGSEDKTIKRWDAQTGSELRTFGGHSYFINSVAFSPDGQRIVSGSYNKTAKLWDAQTGSELQTFEGHSNSVRAVAVSPDGQRIVSGSEDKTIKLWNAQSGSELRTFKGHSN
jgi:WD40 repeat protein